MGAAMFSSQGNGGIWSHCSACGTVLESSSTEWLFCLDSDGEFGAAANRRKKKSNGVGGAKPPVKATLLRVEDLTKQLFDVHDLNRNGLLEEDELVSLNERIAMLHRGKDFDTSDVRTTYRNLFRDKLDPDGKPVPYEIFRRYAKEVLNGADDDPYAQVMILEQFVAEAQSGAILLENAGLFVEEPNPQDPTVLSAVLPEEVIATSASLSFGSKDGRARNSIVGKGKETPPPQPKVTGVTPEATPENSPAGEWCSEDFGRIIAAEGSLSTLLIDDQEQRSVRRGGSRTATGLEAHPCVGTQATAACRASVEPRQAVTARAENRSYPAAVVC